MGSPQGTMPNSRFSLGRPLLPSPVIWQATYVIEAEGGGPQLPSVSANGQVLFSTFVKISVPIQFAPPGSVLLAEVLRALVPTLEALVMLQNVSNKLRTQNKPEP